MILDKLLQIAAVLFGCSIFLVAGFMCTRKTVKESFVPGIYVCHAENEFCSIVDTLIVRRVKAGGDEYAVTRRTAFVRIRMGKRDLSEYQHEEWQASYDHGRSILTCGVRPDTLEYVANRNVMSKPPFEYEKVQ